MDSRDAPICGLCGWSNRVPGYEDLRVMSDVDDISYVKSDYDIICDKCVNRFKLRYIEKHKYTLVCDFVIHTREYGVQIAIPVGAIVTKNESKGLISLDVLGKLTIGIGFNWDGPSGPTVDTESFMRGALVHDALYRLMRFGLLDYKKHRKDADKLMRNICKADGMSGFRSWYTYRAVRLGGKSSAKRTGNEFVCCQN